MAPCTLSGAKQAYSAAACGNRQPHQRCVPLAEADGWVQLEADAPRLVVPLAPLQGTGQGRVPWNIPCVGNPLALRQGPDADLDAGEHHLVVPRLPLDSTGQGRAPLAGLVEYSRWGCSIGCDRATTLTWMRAIIISWCPACPSNAASSATSESCAIATPATTSSGDPARSRRTRSIPSACTAWAPCRNSQVAEQWISGAVGQRSGGTTELWSSGAVEQWCGRITEQGSSGEVEQWSSGAVEQWSCGEVEW
eukprot:990297-Pyramimonas_sp.AAC.1